MNFRQFLGVICAKNLRESGISRAPWGSPLIESGLLSLKALITSRQQGFFKRLGESLHHGSSRSRVFEILKQDKIEDYLIVRN